jgi:hypothetical protein
MAKIRPIVKAAFKVDELVEQFENIDVPDGYLQTGTIEEVNEKYDDAYLVGEARHRLDLVQDQIKNEPYGEPIPTCLKKDERQLTSFIKTWSK